jgi:hypothetical protein
LISPAKCFSNNKYIYICSHFLIALCEMFDNNNTSISKTSLHKIIRTFLIKRNGKQNKVYSYMHDLWSVFWQGTKQFVLMQKVQTETDKLDRDIRLWSSDKETNIRLLLSTLHHVMFCFLLTYYTWKFIQFFCSFIPLVLQLTWELTLLYVFFNRFCGLRVAGLLFLIWA